MPTKYPISKNNNYDTVASAVTNSLQVSGDTSACEFDDWHVHTQVINAMYTRKWVYDTNPVPGVDGAVSGAPSVSYNYIDINYTVQVTEEKELASYCSGLYQPQQLVLYSDSDTGGLGLSGTITTSAVGYSRRKWIAGDDSEYNCQQTTNAMVGKQPGSYNPTFDTSANIGSHVADLLMRCGTVCPRFDQSLVDY